MSTKSTIASSDNFHFYHEVFDDDHVYLRLDTTHFEAGYGSVMVRIPIHIWETIRHLAGVEFDLVDKQRCDSGSMSTQAAGSAYDLRRSNRNRGA